MLEPGPGRKANPDGTDHRTGECEGGGQQKVGGFGNEFVDTTVCRADAEQLPEQLAGIGDESGDLAIAA